MAISFSRPDPSSPTAVSTAKFTTARRGFETDEVREFLRMVAAELARLQEREKFLERELRGAQRNAPNAAVMLDEEIVTRMLGEEAARILSTAREAASQIKVRAEEGASRLLREATDEAQRLREEAEIEAARRRQDASSDAESEVQMAKQQGRDMVNEARAYRERVLGELARRRELARQQIEQLVHGRDRLLQAFERARIAAVDVMSEMTPLNEPNEYVNLSPTTGPVPLMVPINELRPEAQARGPRQDDTVAVDVVFFDVEAMEADEAAATEEEVVVVMDGLVVDDTVVEEAVVEDGEPHDDNLVLMRDAHESHEDAADHPSGEIAPVVALFAGESSEAAPEKSVDSLFARLRASRADSVAERASVESTDEPTAVDTEAEPETDTADDAEPVAEELSVFQASPVAPIVEAEHDDSAFGRRDAELTPLIVASARKLKRVLADEQNDVLHVLRRAEPVRSLDALLPKQADQVQRYAASIDGELRSAALAGASSVDHRKKAEHVRDINKQHALAPAVESLATVIVVPLRERLERAIADSDGDNGEMADAVRALYREWKTQRIDEHLDDVARMAFGRGALAALTPGTPVCWTVDPNGPACPDAEDNALAGVIPAGDPFPTDHTCAPAHEGCRCMLQLAPR